MSDPLKVKYESAIYCGLVAAPQFGFRYRCEQIGIEHIPLLASPQGGVAERVTKYREASADREAGVVFRSKTKRKTTPAAAASVASQYLIDDAATPCGDARRGIMLH